MECEIRQDCKDRFEKIEDRLEKGDGVFKEHGIDIAVLKTNMVNLTASLKGLTKAIWGACGTAIVVLVGFVFWYIQNK